MKKIKVIVTTIVIVIIIVVCIGFTGYKIMERNLNQLANSTIKNVELSKVQDGTYTGSYGFYPVSAKVKVTVKNHKITGIELIEHKNGKGTAAEIIPDRVVQLQRLDVDAVSGATYSSKAILKAIENALNSVNK